MLLELHLHKISFMVLKKKLAISESGFVFDPTTGESFSLNETGAEILNLMRDGKSDEEIKQYILKNYEVYEMTFSRSYLDFLGMLKLYNITEEK